MARFDFYDWPEGNGYLLDCQANLLSHFKSRLVVPLMRDETTPPMLAHLHPIFEIKGIRYLMATHLATSIPARELNTPVGSLTDEDMAILGAIDMLISGY